jgi:hypothetical protein
MIRLCISRVTYQTSGFCKNVPCNMLCHYVSLFSLYWNILSSIECVICGKVFYEYVSCLNYCRFVTPFTTGFPRFLWNWAVIAKVATAGSKPSVLSPQTSGDKYHHRWPHIWSRGYVISNHHRSLLHNPILMRWTSPPIWLTIRLWWSHHRWWFGVRSLGDEVIITTSAAY